MSGAGQATGHIQPLCQAVGTQLGHPALKQVLGFDLQKPRRRGLSEGKVWFPREQAGRAGSTDQQGLA